MSFEGEFVKDESSKIARLKQRVIGAAQAGAEAGKRHGKVAADVAVEGGKVAADAAVEGGKAVWKTKIGKRAVTGAVGGGAVGFALPIITIVGGAALGAGLYVIYKGLKDKD